MHLFTNKENANRSSLLAEGGGKIAVAITIIALLVTAVSCKQVYVVVPPEIDETIETFTVTDLDSLSSAVRNADDGDTIDIKNVSVNPEWNRLPLRLSHDINITGSLNISTMVSARSIDDVEDAVSRAVNENAESIFEIQGNAKVVFNSFTVNVEESAVESIRSIISIDRGSASLSEMTVSGNVVTVELGVSATAESVSGSLEGLTVEVNPDNPSSFEIAQEVADKTGASSSVGGETFAVIDIVQNKGYSTLKEAFDNAVEESVIKLGEDIVADYPFELYGKKLTLDLNGKKISGSDSIVAQSGIIVIKDDSDIVIDDSSDSKTGTIDGNTNRIYGPDNYFAIYSPIGIWPADGHKATLTVNDGTFTGSYYGIVGSGTCKEEGCTTITINGGTFMGNGGSAIYHPQNGSLTIKDGEFTGAETAVEIRAGELRIEGGEFTAIRTPSSSNSNESGTTTVGSAIAIAQHTTKLPISVEISNGTYKGYSAVYESNPQNNSGESLDLISIKITGGNFNATNGGKQVIYSTSLDKFISGGTFNIKPDDRYIAEGFSSEKTNNGWTIETYGGKSIYSEDDFERKAITSIGGTSGFNDESAIILNGDIKLMTDLTTEHIIYVPEGTTAILDLNGHVIESQFQGYSIANFGKLTINDSTDSKDEKGTGIVYNSSKILGAGGMGHDAVRNFGELIIYGGTFGDSDTDETNENDTTYGASIRNLGDLEINGGFFTCLDNFGKWDEGPTDDYFSYAIRSESVMTMNGGKVYGRMNGGIAADAGTVIINEGTVDVNGEKSWHTFTIANGKGTITINGGEFSNTDTKNGTIFSCFQGMPSWSAGMTKTELENNGYFINGGTFIEDGSEITISD